MVVLSQSFPDGHGQPVRAIRLVPREGTPHWTRGEVNTFPTDFSERKRSFFLYFLEEKNRKVLFKRGGRTNED